jgi:hypothetical protein
MLPASGVCALAAHALVYRSFLPAGAAHRYLAWYEPLLGGLTLASLGALAVLGALAAAGRSLPWRLEAAATRDLWSRIAAGGVLLFLVQESLERSLSGGGVEVASLSAGTWLVLLAAVGAFAAVIALVARSGAALVRLVLGLAPGPHARRAAVPRPRLFAPPRRRNPLAERRGLRAPPLLAG